MPRDQNGNYTLPLPDVIPGTVIDSVWANTTMDDVAISLTDSLDRNGRGGMLVPFQNADGIESAPGMTFGNEPTSGFYRAATGDVRASVQAQDIMRWFGSSAYLWLNESWQLITSEVEFDAHVEDLTIHYTVQTIDHTLIQNIGVYSHVQLDSHVDNDGIHYPQVDINHLVLQNIGTNSHVQIDSHIVDLDIHFPDAPVDGQLWGRQSGGWAAATGLTYVAFVSSPAGDVEPTVEDAWNLYANDLAIVRSPNEIFYFNWPSTSEDVFQMLSNEVGPVWTTVADNWITLAGVAAVWGQITGTLSNQLDLQAELDLKATVVALDAHTTDLTIHFTVASISHTAIQDIGTNTHVQLDAHVADLGIHYLDAPADSTQYGRFNNAWTPVIAGVTVHGALSGLGADDHTQYLNNARGDARYPQIVAFNTHVADTDIHFDDAVADGQLYARQNNLWAPVTGLTYSGYVSSVPADGALDVGAGWNLFADAAAITRLGGEIIYFNWPSTTEDLYQFVGTEQGPVWTTVAGEWLLQGGAATSWGAIVGTLSDQTDLQTELNLKATVVALDAHTGDALIHFTMGAIDHLLILNVGTNTHAQIDAHIAATAIHFTVASIDHTLIQGIGTNTHPQLDTHVATANIHFADSGAGLFGRTTGAWTDLQPILDLKADQTAVDLKANKLVAINAQVGTAYTLAATDELVTLNNGGAIILTLPLNSSVPLAIGFRAEIAQLGAGQVTVAGEGAVIITSKGSLLALTELGSGATLTKLATDTWLLVGDLA